MSLDKDLLKILACPDDKSDVKYTQNGKTESLACTKCKRVFEVKDGIPIMLPKGFSS
jgi:uncharacterized protein YbaR (Trm112 family)